MSAITDLSHTYHNNFPGFSSDKAKTIENDGWNASTYHLYSHSGTHMDAPVHFGVNDGSIDQIPVERLVCNCHILSMLHKKPMDLITVEDVIPLAYKLKKGEGIIFHTGWASFINDLEVWRYQLPRISVDLARWLVDKNVPMIGVEPPSVADVNNIQELTEVHNILLSGNILIIEGLTHLEKLRSDYVQIIALPLKIKGGDGAPCRVIAIEN